MVGESFLMAIKCVDCESLSATQGAMSLRFALQRGTKLDAATSPLPSRGPKRDPKCYVTPAFSGVPNAKHGEKIRSGPQVGTSPTSMHFQ